MNKNQYTEKNDNSKWPYYDINGNKKNFGEFINSKLKNTIGFKFGRKEKNTNDKINKTVFKNNYYDNYTQFFK